MSDIAEGKVTWGAKTGVNSGRCAGVYDKKLLWRANLYIDERIDENGDWKIEDANEYLDEVNKFEISQKDDEWNTFNVKQKEALDNLDWNGKNPWPGNTWDTRGDGLGKQIEITPWTHPGSTSNSIDTIYTSVAYSYADNTPINFNSNAQLAPNNTWTQYPITGRIPGFRFHKQHPAAIAKGQELNIDEILNTDEDERTDQQIINLNEYIKFLDDHDLGLHCVQFRNQAAFYDNHQYKYDSYKINNLSQLVPGDYIFWAGGVGHMGIINTIEYSGDRQTSMDQIMLIHSTTYGGNWYVQNQQSFANLGSHGTTERLKIKTEP